MSNIAAFPPQVRDMLAGPYWRVIVAPVRFQSDRIPYEKLRDVLEQTQVRIRGWYFPHLSNKPQEICRGENYYGTWCVFSNYEFWRFYESGQLVHYHGMREAVDESYAQRIGELTRQNLEWLNLDWSSVRGYIDIVNFLYTVFEIFFFAARLGDALRLEEAIRIEVKLRNINGFVLGVSDPSRAWHGFYQWSGGTDLGRDWNVEGLRLMTDVVDNAIDAVAWFFHRFGWEDVNKAALRDALSGLIKQP